MLNKVADGINMVIWSYDHTQNQIGSTTFGNSDGNLKSAMNI